MHVKVPRDLNKCGEEGEHARAVTETQAITSCYTPRLRKISQQTTQDEAMAETTSSGLAVFMVNQKDNRYRFYMFVANTSFLSSINVSGKGKSSTYHSMA